MARMIVIEQLHQALDLDEKQCIIKITALVAALCELPLNPSLHREIFGGYSFRHMVSLLRVQRQAGEEIDIDAFLRFCKHHALNYHNNVRMAKHYSGTFSQFAQYLCWLPVVVGLGLGLYFYRK
jgi:hypothetical protein